MTQQKQIILYGMENVTLVSVISHQANYSLNDTKNDSTLPETPELNFDALFIFGCFLFIFGVLGNAITAFVIYCDRKLHNATYTVIALLAITDLLAIGVRFVTFLMSYPGFIDKNFLEKYINVFFIGNFVTLNSSNFIIVLLARLRYRLLVYPLHTANITKRQVEMQCALAWLVSVILGIPYGCNLILNLHDFSSYIVEMFWTFYLYFSTIIPIMTYHCLKVKNIRGTMTSSEQITQKMATMVAVILSLQVISVLPLLIGQIVILVTWNPSLGSFVQCGLLLNHTINPVVFFMFAKLNTCLKKSELQKERLKLNSTTCTSEMI
ncbi:hypothetical protein FSP39_019405 [Pinctada imbricata]|uniref:G-protein coupled receptors family 1 profile domain-containing protein n=1 Tax=Pinctada imbricata TaxID=66713 RepID=A0AA88YJ08_PINIB|nr:hypothetical protein FSP39_019405 [Pinctada imbricata]